jgi:hypothetical protein
MNTTRVHDRTAHDFRLNGGDDDETSGSCPPDGVGDDRGSVEIKG